MLDAEPAREGRLRFLSGGGHCARLIEGFDWSKTALGAIDRWSTSLRSAVAIMLRSPVAMVVLHGPEGVMLYNDAYAAVAGARHPSALGSKVRESWPEIADFNDNVIRAAMQGRSLTFRDQPLTLSRNGCAEETTFTLDFSPLLGDDDQPAGVFAIVQETTARVAAEERLARDQEALRVMVEKSSRDRDRLWLHSQELMLVCDFTGTVSAVNPAATRILGWTESEMIGRTLADFLHPDDLESTAAEVVKLSGGATTLAFENRYRTKEGSYRLLAWTAVPEGENIHAVARDITRERDTEEALRQSQKMDAIGQLTGGVAHDFNNLLTVIQTSIDLMRRPSTSPERHARLLESISNGVSRATRLTGQLLAFARRQALQPAVFDAASNVRAVIDMIGTLVGSRIVVTLEAHEHGCIVNADASQLDTAVINMAVNARDAMNGSGRLSIGVHVCDAIPALRSHPAVPGRFVAIALSDTGSGISADSLGKIFEPFYTTKGVGLGTGLGLSQVFGFAKQSGGDIQVSSTLGEGSTFTIYLPCVAAAPEPAAGPGEAGAEDLFDSDGGVILMVEDNVEVAATLAETLEELGYTTVVRHDANEALEEIARDPERFRTVFSDVVMPGMDGIQFAYEVRRRFGPIPIVLSSGYSHVLAQDDAHGFDLLPKPYTLEALMRALRNATSNGARVVRPRRLSARLADRHLTHAPVNSDAARRAEFEAMRILDTEEEQAYDDLTRMAATFCDAPIALISLVDTDRQWFKSRVGLQVSETPREFAFCAHAIEDPSRVMIVNDAQLDSRFVDNPLVTGDPSIRFYAGAPLVTSSGNALGTLCVIDSVARNIEPAQLEMLQFLARQVMTRLEERREEVLRSLAAPD